MSDTTPPLTDATTRMRILEAAGRLFREKGYHGVGLAEILKASKAPKGSLYHHFPNGKADLAHAAADWVYHATLRVVDDAFRAAPDYRTGATTLCYKLAKLFDITGQHGSCPMSSVLQDGPNNEEFRKQAEAIFAGWIAAVAAHAMRLGEPEAQARDDAETLLIGIEGAWMMARARGSADVLRSLPRRLFER